MNKNIVIERMKSVGLGDSEARVYIACLESGLSPVSVIGKASKLNRITTYDILEKLIQRGFASYTNIKGVKHFSVINPESFVENLQKKANELTGILPFIKSLVKANEAHQTVRYFEGIEGVKNAYKETLSAIGVIYNYANSKNIRDHWPEYDEEYVKLRTDKKIFLKGFAPNDAKGKWVIKNDKKYYRKIKLLPKKSFEVENEIKIFDNKVLICSYEPKLFAIIIESEAVANTQIQIFEFIWNIVK